LNGFFVKQLIGLLHNRGFRGEKCPSWVSLIADFGKIFERLIKLGIF